MRRARRCTIEKKKKWLKLFLSIYCTTLSVCWIVSGRRAWYPRCFCCRDEAFSLLIFLHGPCFENSFVEVVASADNTALPALLLVGAVVAAMDIACCPFVET